MKIYDSSSGKAIKIDFIHPLTIQDELSKLKTSRACPTGFNEKEIKRTMTLELIDLRKSIYEYLNGKACKTRNIEFVHLIKRISQELDRRNMKVPVSVARAPIKSGPTNDLGNNMIDSLNIMLCQNISSEHSYLLKKRNKGNYNKFCFDEVISSNHFSLVSVAPLSVPSFLNDKLEAICVDNKLAKKISTTNDSLNACEGDQNSLSWLQPLKEDEFESSDYFTCSTDVYYNDKCPTLKVESKPELILSQDFFNL